MSANTTPRTAIYSGTFDPMTLGHLDVIVRAAGLFDRLVVAVAAAHHKKTLFTLSERMALVEQSLPAGSNIEVLSFGGLVVDCCQRLQAQSIVRGVRNGTDMDYESQMAQMNRKLDATIDTLFMLPDPSVQCISSTLVREISRLGGDISTLVPAPVAQALAIAHARKAD